MTRNGEQEVIIGYRARGELLRRIRERARKYNTTVSIAARQMADEQGRAEEVRAKAAVPEDLGTELGRVSDKLKTLDASVAEINEEFGRAIEGNTQAVITLAAKVSELSERLDTLLRQIRVRTNRDD